MDILVSIAVFPITALVWIFNHWELILAIIGVIILWAIFYPIYSDHRDRLAREADRLKFNQEAQVEVENNIAADEAELENERRKYPVGDESFSYVNFISNFDFDARQESIENAFMDKLKRAGVSVQLRGNHSFPDSQLFLEVYEGISDGGNLVSPENMKKFLTADSRLVQVWAMQQLMKGYFFGGPGFTLDYGKSYEYARKISHISSDAMYCIGAMYLNGHFLNRDYQKAFDHLVCSAISGDAEAHDLLGDMYSAGLGIPVDKPMAYALYNIAYSLKPNKDHWREKRDSFVKNMTLEEMNKGQSLTSMILDSNYRKFIDYLSPL